MEPTRLTPQEYRDATAFMATVVVEPRYTDYVHTIWDSSHYKPLLFHRDVKSGWVLRTPYIRGSCSNGAILHVSELMY